MLLQLLFRRENRNTTPKVSYKGSVTLVLKAGKDNTMKPVDIALMNVDAKMLSTITAKQIQAQI